MDVHRSEFRKNCFREVEHCQQVFFLIFVDFFKTTKALHCQKVLMASRRFFAKTAELRSAIYAIILDICVIIRKKNKYKIFLNDLQYLAL